MNRKRKLLLLALAFALFVYFGEVLAQLAQCTITGTIYDVNGNPASGIRLRIVKVVKSGQNVLVSPYDTPATGSNGVVTFNVPRSSTAYVYANTVGLRENGQAGVALTIPNAAIATLESLVSVASVPSTGVTVKDEGVSFTAPVGTFNFVGTGVTATEPTAGTATITISGGGDVVGPTSATDNAIARFDLTTGKLIQNSGVTIDDSNNIAGVAGLTATSFSGSGASLTNLNATNLASGTVPDARFPATLPAASGVNLTNLNASNLASGTVPTARLGSGTPDATTFLRGDSTWASVSVAPFADTQTIIKGSADATKLLRFEIGGFTPSTTRIITPPDADITLAGINLAQTWTATQTFNSGNLIATQPRIITSLDDTNGNGVIEIGATASAVNHFKLTNATAGNDVTFAAVGDSASIGIIASPKGSGDFTLSSGRLILPSGSSSTPSIRFGGNTRGLYDDTSMAGVGVIVAGVNPFSFGFSSAPFLVVSSNSDFVWANSSNATTGTKDTGLSRAAAGVVKWTNGGTGAGGPSSPPNSPAQLAADANDYSPGVGWFQRWSSDASRNVTGMAAGQAGETRLIWNVGSQNIVLQNENAGSTAANRFTTTTGADLTLSANKCALAQYDSVSSRWRVTLLP